MNIKYEDGKLTLGYTSIIFLSGDPVAYSRCTGGVFYLDNIITLDELRSYYPDTVDKQFSAISKEAFNMGIIPMLMTDLSMYNLHQLDMSIWYNTVRS